MPNEPSTNTYETINYNMFKYGFDNPNPAGSSVGLDFVNITDIFGTLPTNNSASAVTIGEGAFADGAATNSIAIYGAVLAANALSLGDGSVVFSFNALALGDDSSVGTNSDSGVSIGANSSVGNNAADAVQLGNGTNNTPNTIQYKSVPLANDTGLLIPGPFADDTAASGGGVGIGNPYYTAAGDMKVRLV